MAITFTKTGKFALHPVHGPIIECIENDVCEDLTEEQEEVIVNDGWALYNEDVEDEFQEIFDPDTAEE